MAKTEFEWFSCCCCVGVCRWCDPSFLGISSSATRRMCEARFEKKIENKNNQRASSVDNGFVIEQRLYELRSAN